MGEEFKGWRRKAGLITLGFACVLALLWVNSFESSNNFSLFGVTLQSDRRGMELRGRHINHPQYFTANWIDVHYRWNQIAFIAGRVYPSGERWFRLLFPHWAIVLPLTFASACLLVCLSPSQRKPRVHRPLGLIDRRSEFPMQNLRV